MNFNANVDLDYRKININELSKDELKILRQNYGPQQGFNRDNTRVGSFGSDV